eukprot:EG_transcript_53084
MHRAVCCSRTVSRLQSFLQIRHVMERITFPALSPTMTEGRIAQWKKKVGDRVKPGDILAAVETDKATLDWEWAGDEGWLAQLTETDGLVRVGDAIAVWVEEEAELAAGAKEKLGAAPAA